MTPSQWIEGIALADLIVLWLGLGSLAARFQKLIRPLRWLVYYLLAVGSIEILAKLYVYDYLEGSNLYLLHIYTPLEYALLVSGYSSILRLSRSGPWSILLWVLWVCILFYSVFSLWFNTVDADQFRLYSKLVVNGSMIVLACTFFVQCLKHPGRYMQHINALGLANSGVLLYFAGSFIIYLILHQLINSRVSEVLYLWIINAFLTFTFHLICIIALWQRDSRLTKTSPYG